MYEHPPHATLATSRACLDEAIDTIAHHSLSVDSLRCAVSQTRKLTARLARLANVLADRARSDLDPAGLFDRRAHAGSINATIGEIVQDLRATSRHLVAAHLLLEPADEDLAHLVASDGQRHAVSETLDPSRDRASPAAVRERPCRPGSGRGRPGTEHQAVTGPDGVAVAEGREADRAVVEVGAVE